MNNASTAPKALWNPYAAGVFLGIVLLLSFLVMGQGLGASGGLGRMITSGINLVNEDYVAKSAYFGRFVADGANPLMNYLVFLGFGVLLGGFIGAFTGNRIKPQVERGPNISKSKRLIFALSGGIIMGYAARLAYGCTSGQALTGGAGLAAGSWAFMMMVFAGGYAVAWFVRRQWL
jgi:uncharacterized membrane protein YedE/YeeE